jgi:single-strand DNA-binding protein
MGSTVNKVTLLGNVGKDPELRQAGSSQVASFSLATTKSWKDKDGNKKEKTEWHRCDAWGKLGEIVAKYVIKGNKLYVEGSIEYDEYEKDGVKKYSTKIVLSDVTLLGKKDSEPKAAAQSDELPF